MANFAAMNDDMLVEYYEGISEIYGELDTQFRSEVALYGDAWPGAAIQLAEIRRSYEASKAELDRRYPPQTVADPADDIPY